MPNSDTGRHTRASYTLFLWAFFNHVIISSLSPNWHRTLARSAHLYLLPMGPLRSYRNVCAQQIPIELNCMGNWCNQPKRKTHTVRGQIRSKKHSIQEKEKKNGNYMRQRFKHFNLHYSIIHLNFMKSIFIFDFSIEAHCANESFAIFIDFCNVPTQCIYTTSCTSQQVATTE